MVLHVRSILPSIVDVNFLHLISSFLIFWWAFPNCHFGLCSARPLTLTSPSSPQRPPQASGPQLHAIVHFVRKGKVGRSQRGSSHSGSLLSRPRDSVFASLFSCVFTFPACFLSSLLRNLGSYRSTLASFSHFNQSPSRPRKRALQTPSYLSSSCLSCRKTCFQNTTLLLRLPVFAVHVTRRGDSLARPRIVCTVSLFITNCTYTYTYTCFIGPSTSRLQPQITDHELVSLCAILLPILHSFFHMSLCCTPYVPPLSIHNLSS